MTTFDIKIKNEGDLASPSWTAYLVNKNSLKETYMFDDKNLEDCLSKMKPTYDTHLIDKVYIDMETL